MTSFHCRGRYMYRNMCMYNPLFWPGGIFFAKKMRKAEYMTMIDPLQEKLGDWMGAVLVLPAICGEIFWSASILGALGQTPFCLTIIHCIAKCCLPYCMLKLIMDFHLYKNPWTDDETLSRQTWAPHSIFFTKGLLGLKAANNEAFGEKGDNQWCWSLWSDQYSMKRFKNEMINHCWTQ